MAMYVYECQECGHQITIYKKPSELEDIDTKLYTCSHCTTDSHNAYMLRIIQPSNFKVKLGKCGNAASGYSGSLGDHPDYSPNRGFDQSKLDE